LEKKKEKKLPEKFGSCALKFLPLHPLLKTKAARVDILFLETVHGSSSFFYFFLPPFRQERRRGKRKGKKEKNFRKNLEVMLLSSYLCTRFLKGTASQLRQRSLNRFT